MRLVRALNEAFQPWADSLTSKEVEALRYYQGREHAVINRVLRVMDRDPEVEIAESTSFVVREMTRLLDSAIGKGKGRLPADTEAFRGLKSYEALFDGLDPSEIVGEAIYDPAFISTSIEDHRAERFMDKNEGFRLDFWVPMGFPVAWLPLIGADDMQGQRELLLPRDLEIEVLGTSQREGILYVEGRIA